MKGSLEARVVFLAALAALTLASSSQGAIHPQVELLDTEGGSVLDSGGPISTMKTCGRCHDTGYIENHSYHVSLATEGDGQPAALLEQWDPLTYDLWDREGEGGLSLVDWLRRHGALHVGGGFSSRGPDGTPLDQLEPEEATAPWTRARIPGSDEALPWDWKRSGTTEMNCFLCHLEHPAGASREAELKAGNFAWAATATLAQTGVVERRDSRWQWNPDAFAQDGLVDAARLGLGSPGNANCGQCHGAVHSGDDSPFFIAPDARQRGTETTGEIIAPNRIRRSGMNIAGKDGLSRPWDVHAERLLSCVSCHPSVNNPVIYRESSATRPSHLKVDPRRQNLGEYLKRPSHDFARGGSSLTGSVRPGEGAMRSCEDCHDLEVTHQFLAYKERHLEQLRCESCHVPRLFAAARQQTDWTVMTPQGTPRVIHRGVDGDPGEPRTLIVGYEPVLLPRMGADGATRLAPQNLISTWYWLDEVTGQPVPSDLLRNAFLDDDGQYRAAIVSVLDGNADGELAVDELQLVSPEAVDVVRRSLVEQGAGQPSIKGELRPYGVHHDVAPGPWAVRSCQACHGSDSRLSRPFQLASYLPGAVIPEWVSGTDVTLSGEVEVDTAGGLVYLPDPTAAGVYLLGFRHNRLVDEVGRWMVILVLLGVLIHGATRVFLYSLARRRPGAKERWA
jgi:cytochrome c553